MCTSGASGLAESTVPSNAPLGAKLGCQGPLGHPSWAAKAHLNASWTSIGRQVSAKLGFQRTSEVRPKQLPILTELLVNYTFVAGWRHMQH